VENVQEVSFNKNEDFDAFGHQVDGNETLETQNSTSSQTPLIGKKGQANEFIFKAPDSSKRRDRESSPSSDDALDSNLGNQMVTPDSMGSRGGGFGLSGFENQAIGGVSEKLGEFNFSEKQKRTSVTPENPPNANFESIPDGATARTTSDQQKSGIDFGAIKVPLSTLEPTNAKNPWSTGTQLGVSYYQETPFRSAQDLRTGLTDPRFQDRLPRTNFEKRGEDFSDEETTFDKRETGTHPTTKFGLRATDDYQKVKKDVTQYKHTITRLCNKLNGTYKTLSEDQITKELETIDQTVGVFRYLGGKLMSYEMSETQFGKVELSIQTYESKLRDIKVILTTESQWRKDENLSKEKTPDREERKMRELLESVERT